MNVNLRPALAELIGTFALVFIGAGAVCANQLPIPAAPQQMQLLGISLASGLILAVFLPITVPLGGGFLNPAITLTLWVFKRINGNRACWLIAAQLLGGFLAALCLRPLFDENVLAAADFGTPHLNMPAFGGTLRGDPTTKMLLSGIGIEFVLTFLLTFAIYGALLDPRAPQLGILGPGVALTAVMLMGYSLTGAAVNPARWLGPALWELTLRQPAFRDHAVYWIGPIFGALLAGGIYEYVLWPADMRRTTTDAAGGGADSPTLADSSTSPVISTLFKKK
jgi:MIP family channel proteins